MEIREMSVHECLAILARGRLARLACAFENQPYVVPIYYAYDRAADGTPYLYGFTTVGQKVEWMRGNPLVCVEWDEVVRHDQWASVIAFGRYEELPELGAAGQPSARPRPPMRATLPVAPSEEDRERLRAQELLQQHTTWWQPGAAVRAASRHRGEPFETLYYRLRIDRLTGHRASPESPGRPAAAV